MIKNLTTPPRIHSKLGITLLSLVLAVSVALGIYFLMPNSTALAEEANENTFSHTSSSEHDSDGWTDLNNSSEYSKGGTLESGYYFLSVDLDLSEIDGASNITIQNDATVYLCLNGYVLTGTGSGRVITVNSRANFTLCDCNTTTTHNYYVNSDGLYVFGDSSDSTWLKAYNEADDEDTGTIYGGVITGGSTAYGGGGVYVNFDTNNTTTFTMYGGTIAGNTTANNIGGGVCLSRNVMFTMNGGTIAGNTAAHGGGVSAYGNMITFNMNDGTISNNTTSENGSGVYFGSSSTINMTGGYLDGSFYNGSNNGGTISISGGYLSQSAYDSILDEAGEPQYIAEGYTIVDISSLGGTDTDKNYVEGFPYGVYASDNAPTIYNVLNSKITAVQTALENAITNLQNASSTDLIKAITDLTEAYEAADDLINNKTGDLSDLDSELTNSSLVAAINSLKATMDSANEAIWEAINALQTEMTANEAANAENFDSLTNELNEVTSQLNTVSVVVWVLLAIVILMLAGGAAYVVLTLKKRR